jgi:hypothetical protein
MGIPDPSNIQETLLYETEESLATTLLKKNLEVSQLQDVLKQSRVNYANRIKKCDDKEQELEIKVNLVSTVFSQITEKRIRRSCDEI